MHFRWPSVSHCWRYSLPGEQPCPWLEHHPVPLPETPTRPGTRHCSWVCIGWDHSDRPVPNPLGGPLSRSWVSEPKLCVDLNHTTYRGYLSTSRTITGSSPKRSDVLSLDSQRLCLWDRGSNYLSTKMWILWWISSTYLKAKILKLLKQGFTA